ncbi:MAG TPA: tyrosine--tRNA ligase [Waddliaceae bacterium]
MKNILSTLEERGFIESKTGDEINQIVDKPLAVYVGFDPTSDSLHLGNLVGIMGLAWFQRFGHTPIAIVGGATGMIGDPSGKSVERNMLDPTTLKYNLQGIHRSIKAVLKTDVLILDNYDWFEGIGFIDFLRDIGKHFRLSTMLAKDSVKTRYSSEEGMSFTEFSYQLLQAYDFLHLFDTHKVILQMGGSDQWGNITAGTELVRKIRGVTVHGLTFPLLTRSDGKKFGKSEEGAIWLNPDKLPPYDFYQYLYRVSDVDVPKLLRMLTFLELEEIKTIEAQMRSNEYIPNSAQKRLAEEVTRIVHGEKGVEDALRITEAAKPGSHTSLDRTTMLELASELPCVILPRAEVIGMKLVDVLAQSKILTSKSEARRMIVGGGVYINNAKINDADLRLESCHLIDGEFLLLGVGKKRKIVIHVK